MAFIQSNGDSEFDFFNVSHNVGASASNYWTDIMLVQYFIFYIYYWGIGNPSSFNISSNEIPTLPIAHRDFKNLKKTEKWVRRFQGDCIKAGFRIQQDGRVDRFQGSYTPITQSIYTIMSLNSNFELAYYDYVNGTGSWQEYALADAVMPDILRGELLRSRT